MNTGKTGIRRSIANIISIVTASLISLVIGIFLIQQYLPGLARTSSVVSFVQSSDQTVPFYSFLPEPDKHHQMMLADPAVIERNAQLYDDKGRYGPHDILGFRNTSVPNRPHTITIGDSQTYGNNAKVHQSWPKVFEQLTGKSTYSMATGGWGAIQYRHMVDKALAFKPERIIVAMYTGNDLYETFYTAYGSKRWADYQLDSSLSLESLPEILYPPPKDQIFKARIDADRNVHFTPALRLASNLENTAINAGQQILEQVILEIDSIGRKHNIDIFFTIIPTKEYVYQAHLKHLDIELSDDYRQLIQAEQARISQTMQHISSLTHSRYIDVCSGMIEAVAKGEKIYPDGRDGHPNAKGYSIIASQLYHSLEKTTQ
jgi:lysophospholipase L1-like esterase